MKGTLLESRRVMVNSGTDTNKIRSLASSHPFTQQEGGSGVDVVFPSDQTLENALSKPAFTYQTCEMSLTSFVQLAKPYVSPVAMESKVVALGMASPNSDDVWSLDSRGILTLSVTKDTYETLGIVGERLPWKEHANTHVIRIHLRDAIATHREAQPWSLAYGEREAAALRAWDQGRGPWKIACHLHSIDSPTVDKCITLQVAATVLKRPNTHIPELTQTTMVRVNELEEWEEHVSSVFEWVGMAALGSQRLSAADRCDPYISVYVPPEPAHVGELTVMRWTGLMPSSAVQSILDTILSPNIPSSRFVSVTAHSVPTSPVSYIPSDVLKASPVRAPRAESEDSWSLICAKDGPETIGWWVLAESVGRWDKRWG